MSASMEARIAEYVAAPTPPLPASSLPLPLPSPLTTSSTDAGAPLVYRVVGIRMGSLLLSTSHRTNIPNAEMPPQKRACFTTPILGHESGRVRQLAEAHEDSRCEFDGCPDTGAFLKTSVNDCFRKRPIFTTTQLCIWIERRRMLLETLEARDPYLVDYRTWTSSLQTQLTTTLGHIKTLEARDPEPQDKPAEAGSSC
ncbi:hypothetical protein Tco_0965803 [Tanacetum coccineum]